MTLSFLVLFYTQVNATARSSMCCWSVPAASLSLACLVFFGDNRATDMDWNTGSSSITAGISRLGRIEKDRIGCRQSQVEADHSPARYLWFLGPRLIRWLRFNGGDNVVYVCQWSRLRVWG